MSVVLHAKKSRPDAQTIKVIIVRTEPGEPGEKPECGAWSTWDRSQTLALVTIVEGYSLVNPNLQIRVRYHHAEPHLSRATMTQLRRAMAQLVTLKRAFGVTSPEVILVEHWAYTDPRVMPSAPGTPVGAEHVNGGCTLSGGASVINCYRHEEFEKVWLHEGIHCFRLDFGHMPAVLGQPLSSARKTSWNTLPIRTEAPVLVNEAWTELLAEAVFVAFRTRSEIGSVPWLKAWTREHLHALKQSACLLRHNGYSSAAELFDGSIAWRERTNALAYYVLRAALMPKHEEWMALMDSATINATSNIITYATPTRNDQRTVNIRYRTFMVLLRARLLDPSFSEDIQRALKARPSCSSLSMMSYHLQHQPTHDS